MKLIDSVQQFTEFVASRFGGKLEMGVHKEDGTACLLEAYSQWAEIEWTDDPAKLDIYDIRPLNDIPMDAVTRTRFMVPLLVAYQGSGSWPLARQQSVVNEIVIETVRQLIAELPGLPPAAVKRCRAVATVAEAAKAAKTAQKTAWAVMQTVEAAKVAAGMTVWTVWITWAEGTTAWTTRIARTAKGAAVRAARAARIAKGAAVATSEMAEVARGSEIAGVQETAEIAHRLWLRAAQ